MWVRIDFEFPQLSEFGSHKKVIFLSFLNYSLSFLPILEKNKASNPKSAKRAALA